MNFPTIIMPPRKDVDMPVRRPNPSPNQTPADTLIRTDIQKKKLPDPINFFVARMLEELAVDYGPDSEASIKTIEGLVNGVQTFIGEVPAFFFAWWVLKKIGHGHCMTLIFLIVGVRYVCYSLIINPWLVLIIEPMQVYYGLFYSTLTSFATIMAPAGTEATVQSLMCAFVEGIGVAIGSFLGGIFVADYGPSLTFRIFGITFLVLAVLNEIVHYFYPMIPKEKGNKF